jgi:hypothetical protein
VLNENLCFTSLVSQMKGQNKMAHYVNRLDERTSKTPTEWLKICSQIGVVVNTWSGRHDLVVYAGSDAGYGHTACFIKSSAEIEINTPVAFGEWATPEFVGDFTQRTTHFDWANATGVIYHEALHARYSEWNIEALGAMPEEVFSAFSVLDEARIERLGVIAMPENQVFLRSSALSLALGELDDEAIEKLSEVRQVAMVCALALARVDAGVLKLSDVRATYEKSLEVLGQELFDELRSVWVEFQKLRTSEVERGRELAEKWLELLKEADPEGEGSGEGEGEGEGEPTDEKGKGKGKSVIKDTLKDDASNSSTDVQQDLNEQQTKEEQQQDLNQRNKTQERKDKTKNEANKVFSTSSGGGTGSSHSRLQQVRPPKGNERANAVRLSQMLEKAKYRERSITEVKSVFPAGRLKTRIAIQNSAMKSKGIHSELPAWRQTKRKHTDDPTLSIGVMVDISGSMSSAMESMATTAWVLSEAGRRVQARTAMVYFGQDVFSTLKVGQKLEQVSVYTAPDGTEVFGRGFDALDGHLNLVYGEGVKLLVVVSDGHYTGGELNNAKQAVKLCADNGVAVLWLSPQTGWGKSLGGEIVGKNGVVVENLDVKEIANVIGRSATDALLKVSSGM